MQAHTQVEIIFADELSQVLVHDDACCFQSFAGNLFEFHSWVRKDGKLMVSLLVRFTRHDTRWTHRILNCRFLRANEMSSDFAGQQTMFTFGKKSAVNVKRREGKR